MREKLTYRIAGQSDRLLIADLLNEQHLLANDVLDGKVEFIVSVDDSENIIGCIGMEQFDTDALLRSFAVDIKYRNNNIGRELFYRLISLARDRGATTIHLLTETAENYFSKKGFSTTQRDKAPEQIRTTTEFSSLCPSSAVYMIRPILPDKVSVFNQGLHAVKKDEETGATYWSVAGSNLQFTCFDVPAHKTFETHEHESEQITYVLEGELFFGIGKDVYQLGKGDSIVIPGYVEHAVWTKQTGAKAVDAWSPVNKKFAG